MTQTQLLLVTCLLFLSCAAQGQTQYSYTLLNFPPNSFAQASGINSRGQIVGSYDDSNFFRHGFLLKSGTTCNPGTPDCLTIDPPGSANTFLSGINDAGQIVGSYEVFGPGENQGFIFSQGNFTPIICPGALGAIPTAINNDGDIVGYCRFPLPGFFGTTTLGFLLSQGVLTTFNTCQSVPFQPFIFLTGINNKRQIVGYCTSGDDIPTGFILSATGSPMFIGIRPASINDAGQILGDLSSTGVVILLNGTVCSASAQNCVNIACPNAPSFATSGLGINDAGQVVGACEVEFVGLTAFIANPACQVKWKFKPFHQWDPPLPDHPNAAVISQPSPVITSNSVPQYFGFLPTPNPPTSSQQPFSLCPTIRSGCALTSVSSLLSSFNLPNPETPVLLDSQLQTFGYGSGDISLCPLNEPNCTANFVQFPDQCEMNWNFDWLFPSTLASVDFEDILPGSELLDPDVGDVVSVDDYLNQHVCKDQDRVILKLDETVDGAPHGPHFVFVTGQASTSTIGKDWTVFDPGWNPDNVVDNPTGTPPSQNINTLQGHTNGFFTNNTLINGQLTVGHQRTFQLTGVRTYRDISSSGSNPSSLSIVANSPVEVLLTDPLGRTLGSTGTGSDLFNIPDGSYVRDFPFADDNEVGTANGDPTGIKTTTVRRPVNGVYQVRVTGTGLGTYHLKFSTLASDSSIQSVQLSGIANAGSTAMYNLSVSPILGLTGNVSLVASFQSTLSDISNTLQLGLISNQGIATSLSQKIRAAQNASGATQFNILNAFIDEVNTQSGKHIIGVAVDVLLQDASSSTQSKSDITGQKRRHSLNGGQ